jgi:hypothetical protein
VASSERDLLTLPELSRRIGAPLDAAGRQLRRLLEAAERATGRPIGVRIAVPRRNNWRVTEEQARRYLPALFGEAEPEPAEDLRRLVQRHMRAVDERTETVARDAAAEVCGQLRAETKSVSALAQRFRRLERCPKSGWSPVATSSHW